METPEQKLARRLAKKEEAKERKKQEKMGWVRSTWATPTTLSETTTC